MCHITIDWDTVPLSEPSGKGKEKRTTVSYYYNPEEENENVNRWLATKFHNHRENEIEVLDYLRSGNV